MSKKVFIVFSVILLGIAVGSIFLSEPVHGYVKLSNPDAVLVISRSWRSRVTVGPSTEAVKVTVGKYRPYNLTLKGKKGEDEYTLYGDGIWGNIRMIDVAEEQTTEITIGSPLKVTTNVMGQGPVVSVGFAITGQGGERYSHRIAKNGRLLPAPKVRILDENQKVLAQGKFEYG